MSTLELLRRIARRLWRSGLLRLSPWQWLLVLRAWWACGTSYAALAAIAAARFPERVALRDDEGALTFAQLLALQEGLARALFHHHRVRAGSTVGLSCRNHRGFVIGLLAASRLGAEVLVLNPDSPAATRAAQLERVTLLLADTDGVDPRATPAAAPRLARARARARVVVLTSGSAGQAKGVRRAPSVASLLAPVAGLLEGLPLSMHQPAVAAIPLFHGYGLAALALALAMGAPLEVSRSLEVAPLLARLADDARAVLITVPTLLRRWLHDAAARHHGRVQTLITGSAPLSAQLCRELLALEGPSLHNLYGSTEAGVIALAGPASLRAAPGSVGSALVGNALRLLDVTGREVAPGEVGVIHVKGPMVLQADAQGWYCTGDLGRVDEGGNLFVCGRTDGMFVSGGENVYPAWTESVLATHPSVQEVAVHVVDDLDFHQAMTAWVVLRPGLQLEEAELRAWLRDRLERAHVPRRLQLVESLPLNVLGKVDRRALAHLARADVR